MIIDSHNPAVLIIAYRREANIRKILNLCISNSIKRIYISLDGPKDKNPNSINDYLSIIEMINSYKNSIYYEIHLLKRPRNRGCAASVLSAIDWVFNHEESAIILEDDCIPANSFFEFSRSSIPVIESSEDIWAACGSQFMPSNLMSDDWFISRYGILWGWVTTKTKWAVISKLLKSGKFRYNFNLSIQENVYWREGALRAISGWVDSWDTLFQQQLIANNKYVIQSKSNLVSNIGNDEFATHTFDLTKILHLKFDSFQYANKLPKKASAVDAWYRHNFYKIQLRHLLSTKLTKIRDILMFFLIPHKKLYLRWENANLDHTNC